MRVRYTAASLGNSECPEGFHATLQHDAVPNSIFAERHARAMLEYFRASRASRKAERDYLLADQDGSPLIDVHGGGPLWKARRRALNRLRRAEKELDRVEELINEAKRR